MAFIEEGSVEYVMIDGKKVPVVKCETEVVLRNKETGYEYNSDKEAEDDIANPDTDTQQEHVTRSLKVKVAAMPPLGAASDEDKEEFITPSALNPDFHSPYSTVSATIDHTATPAIPKPIKLGKPTRANNQKFS